MKSKKKARNKDSKVKNIMRSNRGDYSKIRKIFSTFSPTDIRKSTRELLTLPRLKKHITLYKNEDTDLLYSYDLPDSNLEKSIYWSMGVIANNAEKLNFFIKSEQEICDHIINSNFDMALDKLQEIDIFCGISLWSISVKASILYETSNQEKLKSLYETIEKQAESFSLYPILAKESINKSKLNDSIQENRSRFDRQLKSVFYEDTEDLYFLLKYKSLSFIPTEDYNFEHIFNFEKNSTLIDLFNCCCNFSLYSIINNVNIKLNTELVTFTARHLQNGLLSKVNDLYRVKSKWEVNPADITLLDNYTKGLYKNSLDSVLRASSNFDFSHIEIAAKSACRLPKFEKNNFKEKLILLLREFLLKTPSYHQSMNELYRIQNNYRDLTFYKKLIIFMELSEVSTSKEKRDRLKRTLFLTSEINSPFKSEFILEENSEKLLSVIKKSKFEETYSVWRLYKGEINKSSKLLDSVNQERKIYYYCKYLTNSKNQTSAQEHLEKLLLTHDEIIKHDACHDLLSYYCKTKKDNESIELYNKLVLENRNYIYILSNERAKESANRILDTETNIKAFITLSLFSRYIDSSISPKLRAIFKSLMRENNCTNPIDIKESENWSEGEYIYFLKHICTPKIMKFFPYFKTPTEIDKCRINICNFLIQREKNKTLIESELKDITKKLVLREATLQVAQSKVDSDVSSFKSGENVAHISSYETYAKVIRGKDKELSEHISLYKTLKLINDNNIGITYLDANNKFENSNILFVKLVRTVIEEFSFGEKGLNANVSTRIRHGHLPNTIRRSLLDGNLITSISEQTKVVKNNDYWIEKLSSNESREEISKVLNGFTKKVNDIIHTINEEILQVSTLDENLSKLSKTEKPLFSYDLTDLEIIILQEKTSKANTYNDFINIVEIWLWDITQKNLENIRKYIRENISDELISNLISDISSIVTSKEKLYEFTNIANLAKSSFRKDIETIISWFKKKEISSKGVFELEIAAKIASQALLLDIDLDKGGNINIPGSKLTCFVDILYILYENSISKSDLEKDQIEITHFAELEKNKLKISFKNSCIPFESAVQKNKEISEYINSYGVEDKMMERLHSEGGTGFAKIWKIITKDLGCHHQMNFGFIENNQFNVEIVMDVSELT